MMVYPVRRMPLELPRKILLDSWDRPMAGLVYSLGTPAQKLMVDTACWLYRAGKIDRLMVVHGRTNKHFWWDALTQDIPDDIPASGLSITSPQPPEDQGEINIQPLYTYLTSTQNLLTCSGAIENFLHAGHGRAMLVVDGEIDKGSPVSQAAMFLQQISHLASYRRVMLGALPRVPSKLWPMYKILSGNGPHVLGYPSVTTMRRRFYRPPVWIDHDVLLQKVKAAPTYFMDKQEMDDLAVPLRLYYFDRRDYNAPAPQLVDAILNDLPPKVVVFGEHVPALRDYCARALWEMNGEDTGTVLALPAHAMAHQHCPERAAFFNDPKVQVLVAHPHTPIGRLDCAHAMVWVGNGHRLQMSGLDERIRKMGWEPGGLKPTIILVNV